MKTSIKKAAAIMAAFLLIVGGMILSSSPVFAAGNYYFTSSTGRIHSSVLIIGDSRIVGLAEDLNTKAAFNATIGAHWHTGYQTLNTRISIGSKRTRQKLLVRAILKKYGQCQVVLSASINDINNPDQNTSNESWWYPKSYYGLLSTMRVLSKVEATYRGKTVKPTFYMMGIIQDEGFRNPAILKANRQMGLAYNQKKYGYTYLSKIGYNSNQNTYVSDGCHFTAENSRRVFNAIMDGIKKPRLKV